MNHLASVRFVARSFFVACLLAALAWQPHEAEASLIQDIFVDDTDIKIGEISFPSDSGSSAAGVEFSLFGFDEGDITSITWTLDLMTWAVSTLDLQAFMGDATCPGDTLPCSNSALALSSSTLSQETFRCNPGGPFLFCFSLESNPVTVEFRHAVPLPGTLVLSVSAFAGLGVGALMRRRVAAK